MRAWREACIYQVYVRSFQDSDGDGIGDLPGVTVRLGYLADLGVDAVWLSPIHPSPDVDLGYDVSDYTAVHPRLGTLDAFDELVAAAHARGIRVILDWVVNHTSDQHPWFVSAVGSPASRHRDWYLIREGRAPGVPPNNWRSMFGGPAWVPIPGSGEWYLHTFLAAQPDLDWRTPEVREAVAAAMRFWLDRGVDGFRLDALPMLVKDELLRDNPDDRPEYTVDQPEMAEVIGFLRGVVDEYDGRVLLGEMGLPPARLARYHASVQVPLNFGLITRPWTAERLRSRIAAYVEALPDGAWANWVLGSHDVSRVASRLGPAGARSAAVIQLTLPGTVVVYYGDELGLPDHPSPPVEPRDGLGRLDPARSRDAARSPMPWEPGPVAGFSTGEPWLPALPDAAQLSVAAQDKEPASTLHLYRSLLALRRAHPELALAPLERLAADDGVLSYRRGRFAVAANLGETPVTAPFAARTLVLRTAEGEVGGVPGQVVVGPLEAVVAELG